MSVSNEEFYELSSETNQLLVDAKSLLGLNLLRFRHLVDGSPKGFDCTYARLSRANHFKDRQSELTTLLGMRERLNSLITKLEALDVEEDAAEDYL